MLIKKPQLQTIVFIGGLRSLFRKKPWSYKNTHFTNTSKQYNWNQSESISEKLITKKKHFHYTNTCQGDFLSNKETLNQLRTFWEMLINFCRNIYRIWNGWLYFDTWIILYGPYGFSNKRKRNFFWNTTSNYTKFTLFEN